MRHKKNAGFTLVELMIAMIAGMFAVAGVYYLNGMSARGYTQQMGVSDMQMSLRTAMEQIRRDVARAGYLAAPSTAILRNCIGGLPGTTGLGPTDNATHHFNAITIGPSRSLSYNPTEHAANGAQVTALIGSNPVADDDLTMYGNFNTTDAYLTAPLLMPINRQAVVLNPATESFRRSFFTPVLGGTATPAYALFENTFRAGRMLRVEHGGHFFFRQITNSVWNAGQQPTINLAAALPMCFEPTAWTAVAPVTRIHYGLESDLNPEFARIRANAALPGSRRMLLVRREEDTRSLPPTDVTMFTTSGYTAFATIANTSRIVLDYAVEFGLAAVRNTQTDMTVRPTFDYAITQAQLQALDNTPERFRSLIVTLSARAADVDPRLGEIAPGARRVPAANFLGDPLLTFNVVDPNFASLTTLQTRVRTLRSEIFLHNL